MKKVIINGDDFGLTKSCTDAIYEAYKLNYITDTTMVANGVAFEKALDIIMADSAFSSNIGIHLNLTEGVPLTHKMYLNDRFVTNGRFNGFFIKNDMIYQKLNKEEKCIIFDELCAQVERLINHGINITHADSHQHIHTALYLFPIVHEVMKKYSINKLRIRKNTGKSTIRTLYSNSYRNIMRKLGYRTTDYFNNIRKYKCQKCGISELMVHPDYDSNILIDRYKYEQTAPVGIELSKQLKQFLDDDVCLICYSIL